jgi:general L-amino acid transport system substrate-binding protein
MKTQRARGKLRWLLAAALMAIFLVHGSASAMTLEKVRQRDQLNCGVSPDLPGFSKADAEGGWYGLNVDICRAIAAAVLGDSAKVKFVPLAAVDSVAAILSGEVDVLSMDLEWNLSYDTSIGLDFCGVTFFDGMGFMVPVKPGMQSVLELENSTICPDPAGEEQQRLAVFLDSHELSYQLVESLDRSRLAEKIESGSCDLVSGDISYLAALRTQLQDPDGYRILPETISRRVLGPVVRQGDDGWFNIVRWVLFALKIAEMEGLTSENLETLKAGSDPDIHKLLGLEGSGGRGLGLADDWLARIVGQVGNYGELFSRNLGLGSAIGMDRNLNELWNRGGLHYAPSID